MLRVQLVQAFGLWPAWDEDISGESISGCFQISKVTKGPNLGWEMNELTPRSDQYKDICGESGCFEISKVTKGPNLGEADATQNPGLPLNGKKVFMHLHNSK